jgi:hypothetical protein
MSLSLSILLAKGSVVSGIGISVAFDYTSVVECKKKEMTCPSWPQSRRRRRNSTPFRAPLSFRTARTQAERSDSLAGSTPHTFAVRHLTCQRPHLIL